MTPSPLSALQAPIGRRDLFRLGGLLGGGLVLAACGSDSGSGSGSSSGGVGSGQTIALSLNGNNAYSSYVAEGVLKALEGTGYEFTGTQADNDSSTELANMQSLLSQGVAGIVSLPVDAGTIARAAEQAQQQDVPVGHALWPGESDADQYFAGVAALDSVEGGRMIGEWLKANATPGKVIVIQGIIGQGFSERIDEGLDESLAGTDFEIVIREQGFFSRETATQILESGLQAHPDAKIVVNYSASMANGISAYLEAEGISDMTHVTSDGDDEMFEWLQTPYLTACRYYSAAQTGLLATQAVRAVIEGEEPTFHNEISQEMVTAENADAVVAANPYRYPEYAEQAATV